MRHVNVLGVVLLVSIVFWLVVAAVLLLVG